MNTVPTVEQRTDDYFIDYTIPGIVFNDPELSPFCKLLFGAINGLSKRYGYCNATNRLLAEKVGAEKESVANWLLVLKAKGYLTVFYDNDVSHKGRRIFPSEQFAVIQSAKMKAIKEGKKLSRQSTHIAETLHSPVNPPSLQNEPPLHSPVNPPSLTSEPPYIYKELEVKAKGESKNKNTLDGSNEPAGYVISGDDKVFSMVVDSDEYLSAIDQHLSKIHSGTEIETTSLDAKKEATEIRPVAGLVSPSEKIGLQMESDLNELQKNPPTFPDEFTERPDTKPTEIEFFTKRINTIRDGMLNGRQLMEVALMKLKISPEHYKMLVNSFFDEQVGLLETGKQIRVDGLREHCKNWIRKQVELGIKSMYHPEFMPTVGPNSRKQATNDSLTDEERERASNRFKRP